MRRKNRLSTRETLIDEVWGPSYFGDTKTLDVHIKRLRQKIEVEAIGAENGRHSEGTRLQIRR